MSVKQLIEKINREAHYLDETPREKHRREVAEEIIREADNPSSFAGILTNGNITGRTRFLRLRNISVINGRKVVSDKWVYTNSSDKLLVYITEIVLRYYICGVINVPFEDSFRRSLIDLVTRYELSGGNHETVCLLEKLVFDEYDMVSSPENATEKQISAFVKHFNEAVVSVVKDKKAQSAVILECTKNIPQCVAEKRSAQIKVRKVKYA
ncbi:MAG: hypothetical protein MJ068_04100 [Clostridia bacterium]|nr:hypothetical protein [Clostridia bacterium]